VLLNHRRAFCLIFFGFGTQVGSVDVDKVVLWLYICQAFVFFGVNNIFLYEQIADVKRVLAAQLCWNYEACEAVICDRLGQLALVFHLQGFRIKLILALRPVIIHHSLRSLPIEIVCSSNSLVRGVTNLVSSLVENILSARIQKFAIRI
jgi:hypothetical protein